MKFIFSPQKYALYLFCFSLNFELMNLFNLGIDFLASKISLTILLFTCLLQYKSFFTFSHFSRYLIPIMIYFGLLTIVNFIHHTSKFNKLFDLNFFLNIIFLLILTNFSRIKPFILLKGLFVFALCTTFISVLYFFGLGSHNDTGGMLRYTIFGMNPNELGVKLCLSLFILTSIIFENKLELGKVRYYLFIFFPFLIKFLIDTNSRVAFISFVLGSYIMFRLYYKFPETSRKMNLFISGLVLSLMAFMILVINMDMITRLYDTLTKGDISNRDMIWSKIGPIISNNLFFGIGETGYAQQSVLLLGGSSSPHNVILEVLCYTGLVGLLLFLIFFWRILSTAYVKYKYQDDMLPIVLMIPIFGVILSQQFFDKKILWLVIAFIVSSNFKIKDDNLKIPEFI